MPKNALENYEDKNNTKKQVIPWGKFFLWNCEFKCFFKFWKKGSTHNLKIIRTIFVIDVRFCMGEYGTIYFIVHNLWVPVFNGHFK